MRALFYSVLGYFLTPLGVVVMGALDASMLFFLPLGIDFVVVIMSARQPHLFWLYAVLASIGSVAGAASTFWVGRLVGEHGLAKFVDAKRLDRVKQRVTAAAEVSIASLAIVPPPFPFTPFVLTSGALELKLVPFFSMLAAMRVLRFFVEGGLAARYGARILRWTKTPVFEGVIVFFIVVAVVGTIVSAIALIRGSRTHSH
ncbi:MAG TPA: VTT domain-containing protein [Vicinamibacterales bacterium]|nr:VTT domain-containing protein [Vicinamibacterales bacterium]